MGNKSEKFDLLLEAAVQSIPYVGGSLSTLYFGNKNNKRFERIETFYKELKTEIEGFKSRIPSISTHDQDSLASILEMIHDQIESEHLESKRQVYKRYYLKTLFYPVTTNNYDQRATFLQVLKSLNHIQLIIFAFICDRTAPIIDRNVEVDGVEWATVHGSIAQLKILGLVDARLGTIAFGSNNNNFMSEYIQASSFGKSFHSFCMD